MTDGLSALREGRAMVKLSTWRKVVVRGRDASPWLNDLLTAELSGLVAGEARRSLLLSPTGRIRADVAVTPDAEGFLLLQDPIQPSPIDSLLARYVLSSDVVIEDRSGDRELFAAPPGSLVPAAGARSFRPSPLGRDEGVLLPRDALQDVSDHAHLVVPSPEDLEAFRVEQGVPRFGIDLGEDSLPHEAPMGKAIAHDKGCFLGQEAVAKVRNLGHPPFVVIAVLSPDPVEAGNPVMTEGREVGRVTSAARLEDGTAALARVRWAARKQELRTRRGTPLRRRDTRSGWESATG
jgi:folate-binding protein YgfZ